MSATLAEAVFYNADSTSPLVVSKPAGAATDDVLVFVFSSDSGVIGDFGTPSGWAANATTVDITGQRCKLWSHVVAGGDPSTWSFSYNAGAAVAGVLLRYTGADTTPTLVVTSGNSASNSASIDSPTATPSGADDVDVAIMTNSGGGATLTYTQPTGLTDLGKTQASSTFQGIAAAWKALSSSSATGAQTWTSVSPTARQAGTFTILVKSAATATSIPYNPQRSTPQRDPGEVWWIQRDRRDANTVATAANPLPSPLDSAWQASARYWHLYGDAAGAAPRTWQSLQRRYVSDPNLLAPTITDPLTLAAGVGGDLWRRYNLPDYADRREVPQQRAYVSDPLLLGTALLENELLGSADTARHAQAAAFVDRREVPQQRPYVSDPLLLTTAELENELLGGADTTKRANVPATHAARWWMPQQPLRDGQSPGLLDDALLENELLGGADDRRRRALLAATHVDRREVPQQPPRWSLYFDGGPDSPPLTLTWGAGGRYWALYNQAGWQPDRREVPQQRAYISDPSTYPLVPPTDPLTLAFGAGGTYWLLYNTAALQVDRRKVPQQRRYVSDPGLLASALLENELLGGADLLRRYLAAAYVDRRQTATQPPRFDPSSLAPDADPLAVAAGVGGDLWRRANTPAYADRRQVPEQPPRWTVYLDAGPGSPPLTLSWGVGGTLWHLYNRAADLVDRTWRPQQRTYLSDPLFYFVAPPVNANSTALVGTVHTSTGTVTATVTSVTSVSAHATSTPTVSDG